GGQPAGQGDGGGLGDQGRGRGGLLGDRPPLPGKAPEPGVPALVPLGQVGGLGRGGLLRGQRYRRGDGRGARAGQIRAGQELGPDPPAAVVAFGSPAGRQPGQQGEPVLGPGGGPGSVRGGDRNGAGAA